jgi:hypothetical protein
MVQECFPDVGAMIVCIKTLDKTPTVQGADLFQHSCRESLLVVGHEVSLDFVWTSPLDVAERASS